MKLPEPVAWSVTWDKCHCGNFFQRQEYATAHKQRLDAKFPQDAREVVGLFDEAQLREALAQQYDEMKQLQEQNTYLDKVAAELQDLCDRQAKKLEILPASPVFHTGDAAVAYLHGHKQAADKYEAVMRQALKCLKNSNAVSFDDLHAIKALEEQLK